jgi:ankyrin repeat protein
MANTRAPESRSERTSVINLFVHMGLSYKRLSNQLAKQMHDHMKELVEEIKNFDAKSEDGMTLLCKASASGHTEIVRLLLEHKATVDLPSTFKSWTADTTPLMLAAQKGHDSIVRVLVEKKADVDKKNAEGCTALILAAKNGRDSTVELLLRRSANSNLIDAKGKTALYYAMQKCSKATVELLKKAQDCFAILQEINNGFRTTTPPAPIRYLQSPENNAKKNAVFPPRHSKIPNDTKRYSLFVAQEKKKDKLSSPNTATVSSPNFKYAT